MNAPVKIKRFKGALVLDALVPAPDIETARQELQRLVDRQGSWTWPIEYEGISSQGVWLEGESRPQCYSCLEMEAALCVWEWINEVTLLDHRLQDQAWIDLRSNVGSVELRHASMSLGRWCLQIHDICTKDDKDVFEGHAYDFEVIPAMMSFARDHEGAPSYDVSELPAPEEIAPKVLKQLNIHTEVTGPGYWKETPDAGLSFFRQVADNEHWFPSFDAVELKLRHGDLLEVLNLMNHVQGLRNELGHSLFEAKFSAPVADQMNVISNGNESFNPKDNCIRVIATTATLCARFEVRNKHTGDRIVSDDFTIETVKRMIAAAELSTWENNPDHPVEDWQTEVANSDTRRGYRDWLEARKEAAD